MAKSKCTGCEHWKWWKAYEYAMHERGGHYCDIWLEDRFMCDKFNQ